MGSNRRAFLKFAGLAPAAAATAGLAASRPATAAAGPVTRSACLACVGEEFVFEAGPFERRPAKLVAVAALSEGGREVSDEGRFRLVFEPAVAGSIAQETYAVTHPAFGRFALFVSPNDAEGRVVEAVFNRL